MARRGMYAALRERLARADEQGKFLVPMSRADARCLNKAVKRGDLISPAQGVYLTADMWQCKKPTDRSLAIARSLQELHPTWVFCGVTAALAYGMAVSFSLTDYVHRAVSRKTHTNPYGARGVVRHVVSEDSIVEVSGIRVTSIERTVFDCLRSLGFREGLAIVDSTLQRKLVTAEALSSEFASYSPAFFGRSRAIETLAWADGRAESGGESVARAVMIERGFRLPELQHEVPDPVGVGEGYRVDFFWELAGQRNVIGELDGREKYLNPQMTGGRSAVDVLADERLRESRVSGSDAKVMRFSFSQVMDRTFFTRLLCAYGIPRDAEIPWVALRDDDPEAHLSRPERLFLGRWLPYAERHGLPMPCVA